MSANNYLNITKKDNRFYVQEKDMDTGSVFKVSEFNKDGYTSLEEAIKVANDYMKYEEVEGGLDIDI